MHEITFDGKQYSKANVLAKELGYTADYIGQLCRSGKVDARLVGRAWFVNRESVLAHQSQRYEYQRTQQSVEMRQKPEDKSLDIKVSRIDVPPVQSKHSRKHFYAHQTSDATLRIPGSAQYEIDSAPLVPLVSKNAATAIPVNLVGAISIKVSAEADHQSTLRPEVLPTVYMRGSLTVHDVPETVSDEVTASVAEAKSSDATSSAVSTLKDRSSRQRVAGHGVAVPPGVAEPHPAPIVVELPIRPLEVLLSRPVAISVATASAFAVAILVLETIIEIGSDTSTEERWQVANVAELFR